MKLEIKSWKEQAEIMFFEEHMSVSDICMVVRKTRKYVSGHLQGCEGYEQERQYRKSLQKEKRKEYQREWDRNNRGREYSAGGVTADTMRREHDIAVRILSSERY